MESNITLSQIIFTTYIPFIIYLLSFSVPIITILLSVYSEGREEISRVYQQEINKITENIKANELIKNNSTLKLIGQLIKKRYSLVLLSPNYYLPLLIIPPIISIIFSILSLKWHLYLFISLSLIFVLLFLIFLWSLVKLLSKVTLLCDNKKAEYNRSTLETLQNILKNSDPKVLKVKDASIKINGKIMEEGDFLPSATVGKELSLNISFCNNEKEVSAKKAELGLKFPTEAFLVKKQSGCDVYEVENIIRFEEEYIQKNTDLIFPLPLIVTPKRTGTYNITCWIKGENVETKYINLKIIIEIEV